MTFADSMDLATLASYVRSQMHLTDSHPPKPGPGDVHLNHEEASLCLQALESELQRRNRLADANAELRALIEYAEGEWLDFSEDVAMGGGTGSGAQERANHDVILSHSCAMVDRWKAITVILKEHAERV